jgi:DNA-binding LytR/AlgR family response regulator
MWRLALQYNSRVRIVIADDELLARQRLVRLLEAMEDPEVVAVCSSAAELLEVLEDEPVEVALLDVDMPGMTGLEVAQRLERLGLSIIFVTAHPEHALAAFEVGAVDYVVKPVDAERLSRALQRVRARTAPPVSTGPLALPGARAIRLLQPDELLYAEVDGASVLVHTPSGPIHTEWSLAELERRLPADRFVRVHRRTLVALSAIEWLEGKDGALVLRLRDGTQVTASRGAGRALRKRLGL